jgi:threonine 3-dehydrogenase
MMYMPDCLKGTLDLMDADVLKLKHHCDFNFASMSFSAEELVNEITEHIPDFTCEYKPDFRQAIADSWPRSIDDSAARKEWNWKPKYKLSDMVKDMLTKLTKRNEEGSLLVT